MMNIEKPRPVELLKGGLKIKTVHPGEPEPLIEVELKARLDLDLSDLSSYLVADEVRMVEAAVDLTAASHEEKKPHTTAIKVKRHFDDAEYVLTQGEGDPLIFNAAIKESWTLKIVGGDVHLDVTLVGALPASDVARLAKLINTRPNLTTNDPEQLNLLDDDGVAPRKRGPDTKADASTDGDPAPAPSL